MKRIRDWLSIDTAIVGVASVTLATSLVFLFSDGSLVQSSESSASKSNLSAVGTFSRSSNDVRRRVESGITWGGVANSDQVYEGDSVFTGDDSEAYIKLDSGDILTIEPKSLLVIRTRGKKLEIDLQYGSLQGTVASSVVLTQNGVQQELSGQAEIRIVRAEGAEAAQVQVMKGQIESSSISHPKAPKQVIRENEAMAMTTKKPPVVIKEYVKLISPMGGKPVWLASGAEVPFTWKTGGNPSTLKFELARDPSFAKTLFTADVSGTSYSLSESTRPNGTFYWRVRPGDKNGAPSPAKVTFYKDVAPVLTAPNNDQVLSIDESAKERAKSAYLTWSDESGSNDFKVQIAKDEAFADKVLDTAVSDKGHHAKPLPAGNYFWRVSGKNPDRANAPWSQVARFSIQESLAAPVAPVLNPLIVNYQISKELLAKQSEEDRKKQRGVKPKDFTPIVWEKAKGVASFELEVSENADFANSVRRELGANTKFAPKEVRPGALFIRVRAKDTLGRQSPPSEAAKLDIQLTRPELKSITDFKKTYKTQAEYDAGKHSFTAEWEKQPFAASYEFFWGSDPQFTASKTFNLKENRNVIVVSKSMKYAAKVRSLDSDGQPISPFSEVRIAWFDKQLAPPPPVIAVAPPPPPPVPARLPAGEEDIAGLGPRTLPIPRLAEPKADTSLISYENQPTFVTFKWKATAKTNQYQIQIAEDADFTKIVSTSKVSRNGYVYRKALPEGRVFWRVRALGNKNSSQWSDVNDLNVIYQ